MTDLMRVREAGPLRRFYGQGACCGSKVTAQLKEGEVVEVTSRPGPGNGHPKFERVHIKTAYGAKGKVFLSQLEPCRRESK